MIIEPATVFSFDGNGFQWRSGTLDGGSGLTNEGLIVLASASNKTLRGHLINDGTIRWNQGHIYLATGAVIENRETFRAATTHGIYPSGSARSEEHTSELQSRGHLVCRLLLENK